MINFEKKGKYLSHTCHIDVRVCLFLFSVFNELFYLLFLLSIARRQFEHIIIALSLGSDAKQTLYFIHVYNEVAIGKFYG